MKLSETIASLAATRRAAGGAAGAGENDRLQDLEGFAPDPGNLRARLHIPASLPKQAALVVVLHGCTQTADGYDVGAGWSALADKNGFAVLFPEQRRANNANLCFNWFQPGDIRRGEGEVASIHAMIEAVVRDHAIDPARIFITGLSAGGAMTGAMLATYPELFAGGAIIAGLPFGCATNVSDALERMRGQGLPDGERSAALVRAASSHRGRWPSVSVWYGSADLTVAPSNADAIVAQWRTIHGVGKACFSEDIARACRRRGWRDATGRIVVEDYRIAGMGHGTPLDMSDPDPCGQAGPFMLDAGISSTRSIARSWGLLGTEHRADADQAAPHPVPEEGARAPVVRSVRPVRMSAQPSAARTQADGVGKIIEDALRAAGLMR